MDTQYHNIEQIQDAFQSKRLFFDQGNTLPYRFRLEALKKLKANIIASKQDIIDALHNDFKKPEMETYISEIGVSLLELDYTIKNLAQWMEVKSVPTPITIQPGFSKIYPSPLGVVLIFAPWNYPFNLAITPLISAIASGNCIICKPAHETNNTALVIQKLIESTFHSHHVSVIMGEGRIVGELLLQHCAFNHIHFTGSANVGKQIMEKASRTLTSVTLELGGKSPAIIDKNVDIAKTIQRLVWAKFYNAGQTCISPDYALVHTSLVDKFVDLFVKEVTKVFSNNPQQSEEFARIVNKEKFERVKAFLKEGNILLGGQTDASDNYISPTLIHVQNMDAPIMKEEIFGPILPFITWENKEEIIHIVRKNRYPLTCYIFSESTEFQDFIIKNIEFGGGNINNAMAQFGNHHFPFGGIMTSGMGSYHGKYGFDSFTHYKPVLKSLTAIDVDILRHPYTKFKYQLAKWFIG